MLKPIREPKHPKPGDKRVSRQTEASGAFGVLYWPYQVDSYRGDGFGWDPISVHETYREAVAAKNA